LFIKLFLEQFDFCSQEEKFRPPDRERAIAPAMLRIQSQA